MTGTDGVLVIDKPAGMTSHDVVDVIRKRFCTRRVGHGGTLDPDATGVLLVGLGRATRFLSYAQAAPKRYLAVARFGVVTSTQDASGQVVERRDVDIDEDEIEKAMVDFLGDIDQTPPMVSAVKIRGERLYEKARRGEEVERSARRVTIFHLHLLEFSSRDAEGSLDVGCSGGTYIRTLIHDLGRSLGCGAHLKSLRRIEAGSFSADDAVTLAEVGPQHLRPLVDVVGGMPRLEVDREGAGRVSHGAPLALDSRAGEAQHIAVVRDGRLLGVYKHAGDRLVADRVVGS